DLSVFVADNIQKVRRLEKPKISLRNAAYFRNDNPFVKIAFTLDRISSLAIQLLNLVGPNRDEINFVKETSARYLSHLRFRCISEVGLVGPFPRRHIVHEAIWVVWFELSTLRIDRSHDAVV